MKTHKYGWLKKNPIVLLLRRLYQLFFKPKQNFVRFNPEHYLIVADHSNIESLPLPEIEIEEYDDGLVTIGQLFEQVNWHNHSAMALEKSPKAKRVDSIISTTPDRAGFTTVGELLQQVKWRIPSKGSQEQFLTTSKKPQAYDVSLN